MPKENLTLLTDLYQLTMMNGYFLKGIGQKNATFDLFYRRNPFGGGYCIAAGLEDVLSYLESIEISGEDIVYLKSLHLFSPDFLEWLRHFKFTGEVSAIQEGSIVFPNEPILRVTGPLIEAQFIETFCLTTINFQTLIATKASRMWEAAGKAQIIEFGLRRAHGPNGALSASRAAFIGGCEGTSNVMAGKQLQIPTKGTMAHSWVMSFPDELSAFKAYAEVYPDTSIFLVDTYDTLKEGLPHSIQVAGEMARNGHKLKGIRLDSGDLAYLSVEARRMLDEAGLVNVKIVASNDLDEWIIETLQHQGAKIDIWGVGTKLVTAGKDSALGGVYKLSALENADGKLEPKIKISQNVEKTTIPGCKTLYRLYDQGNMMVADVLTLHDEKFPGEFPLTIHHPQVEYKFSRIESYHRCESLLEKVFHSGKRTIPHVSLPEIQKRTRAHLAALHPTHKRLANPHTYKVGLTANLWNMRQTMIRENLPK